MQSLRRFVIIAGSLALLLISSESVFAADFYIAQSNTGTGDASSCANALASSWNWAGVADGDTIYLCGTFTNGVSVKTSGTSTGITLKSCKDGEANCGTGNAAAFSAPYWGNLGANGNAAITCYNKSYITIDGNGVGTIVATANGFSRANQQLGYGIYAYGNYIEIKGWNISNIYVAEYMDETTLGRIGTTGTAGIYTTNGSYISVHDNVVHDAGSGIDYNNVSSTAKSNINLYNNTVYNCSWGIQAIAGGAGSVTDTINIYNNDITIGANWMTPTNLYHNNGSYNYANGGDASMSNLHFYNNYIHGPASPSGPWTCSSFFWNDISSGTGTFTGTKIYNNLLVGVSGDPANNYIGIDTMDSDAIIANNTIIGYTNGQDPKFKTIAIGINVPTTQSGSITVKNNILKHLGVGLYIRGTAGSFKVGDYNSFFDNGNDIDAYNVANHYYTVAQWRTANGGCPGTGYECFSITSDPCLSVVYIPSKESPLIGAGANLINIGILTLASDKAGNIRPSNDAWTIGAYQYIGGLATPSNLRLEPKMNFNQE